LYVVSSTQSAAPTRRVSEAELCMLHGVGVPIDMCSIQEKGGRRYVFQPEARGRTASCLTGCVAASAVSSTAEYLPAHPAHGRREGELGRLDGTSEQHKEGGEEFEHDDVQVPLSRHAAVKARRSSATRYSRTPVLWASALCRLTQPLHRDRE
jgi:hypothetical protein